MSIEKNIEEMIRRSKEKSCATCKHGRWKSDGLGSIAVYCKHPQNTRETKYKYATECARNEHKYWEPYGKKKQTAKKKQIKTLKPTQANRSLHLCRVKYSLTLQRSGLLASKIQRS